MRTILVLLPLVGGLFPAMAWDWRLMLLGVALAEAGAARYLLALWPTPMAISLWVAGWAALLFIGWGQLQRMRVEAEQPEAWGGPLFRFTIIGFLLLLIWSNMETVVLPNLPEPMEVAPAWAGLGLMIAGTLHMAMTQHPYRVVLSLMNIVTGFVVLYAHVEYSWLLTVLLVGVKTFLGGTGGYTLAHPGSGRTP